MKINEIITEACWDGYKQIGMKKKNGKQVPNCVPVEEDDIRTAGRGAVRIPGNMSAPQWKEPTWSFQEIAQKLGVPFSALNLIAFHKIGGFPEPVHGLASKRGSVRYYRQSEVKRWVNSNQVREKLKAGLLEDWQKTNKQDKTDGMSSKAVKAYRRENPGSKLQTAVTKKPSELKPSSKAAKRRKSFCARMSGVDGPMKDEKGRPTAKAKALKRWNC
jgi:hypothetical protein